MTTPPLTLLLSATLILHPIAPAFLPTPHSPLVTRHAPFTYDGDQILEELDGAGNQTAEYVNGPGIDEPIRMQRGTIKTYVVADGLGSVTHLTDPTGKIIESYTYDPYGKPSIFDASGAPLTTSAFGNRLLFTGREYDAETGLYFNRARYWSSFIGGFLSRDPLTWGPNDPRVFQAGNLRNYLAWLVGIAPSLELNAFLGSSLSPVVIVATLTLSAPTPLVYNLYPYGINNPVTHTDPTGESIGTALVIAAGIYLAYNLYSQFVEAYKNFQVFQSALNERVANPTAETYQQYGQAFCKFAGSLVKVGTSIPGTSVSGPPPTSGFDLVLSALQQFLFDLFD